MSQTGLLAATSSSWQDQLRNVITSATQLLNMLGLDASEAGLCEAACRDFPVKVPHSFVRRMRAGDSTDPLLLQVMSRSEELLEVPGYGRDPVGECGAANPHPGIIHKYHGRVLLIVSGGCAIHCRYCFRRHFPYSENQNSREQWREALDYIRAERSIEEVILSGGDPLVATDEQLDDLVEQLAAIGHVRRLRIHSRLPIVIPQRMTDSLLDAISHSALQTIMVIHCNHANEIDSSVTAAIAAMHRQGITTLNQAVLLAGVNDSVEAQVALNKKLFDSGALPYYLHLLDRVAGAAHFDVPEKRAQVLMSEVAARLPGYMVPRLVREIAGATAKTAVAPFI